MLFNFRGSISFFLFLIASTAMQGQVDVYKYLGLKITAQAPSKLLLIETFHTNKSKNSDFKDKYLYSREEYNDEGRRSLNLFFKPDASLHSKIVAYYPDSVTEKNIFQQSGGFIDSAVFSFNPDARRLSEVWYWGENGSRDTLIFRYNSKKQLTRVDRKYDWDSKWDTLFYSSEGLLEKAVSYSMENGLQKQVDFLFIDSILFKTSTRNPQRLIIEEEFFFYHNNGLIDYSITRLYPEGKQEENPVRMRSKYKYYKNKRLKSIRKTLKNKKKTISTSILKFNREGALTYQHDLNRKEGINKKTQIIYTRRKKQKK